MKKIIIVSIVCFVGLLIIFNKGENNSIQNEGQNPPLLDVAPEEIRAKFRIITNGTTRVFTDPKYHNQSEDVYIDSENPTGIIVKKKGITWNDFFATLPAPMKTDQNCLTTGTNQVFCSSETKKLVFTLNGIEVSDVLLREIKDLDYLLIEYK